MKGGVINDLDEIIYNSIIHMLPHNITFNDAFYNKYKKERIYKNINRFKKSDVYDILYKNNRYMVDIYSDY